METSEVDAKIKKGRKKTPTARRHEGDEHRRPGCESRWEACQPRDQRAVTAASAGSGLVTWAVALRSALFTRSATQEGPALSLVLWCCHLEIVNS